LLEKVTIPVGLLAVPESVSVTVAVQVAGPLTTTTHGEQVRAVEVARAVTVRLDPAESAESA